MTKQTSRRIRYLNALSTVCKRSGLTDAYVKEPGDFSNPDSMVDCGNVRHEIVFSRPHPLGFLNQIMDTKGYMPPRKFVAARILSEPKCAIVHEYVSPILGIRTPDHLVYDGMHIDVVDSRFERRIDNIATRLQEATGERVKVTKDKMRDSPDVRHVSFTQEGFEGFMAKLEEPAFYAMASVAIGLDLSTRLYRTLVPKRS